MEHPKYPVIYPDEIIDFFLHQYEYVTTGVEQFVILELLLRFIQEGYPVSIKKLDSIFQATIINKETYHIAHALFHRVSMPLVFIYRRRLVSSGSEWENLCEVVKYTKSPLTKCEIEHIMLWIPKEKDDFTITAFREFILTHTEYSTFEKLMINCRLPIDHRIVRRLTEAP